MALRADPVTLGPWTGGVVYRDPPEQLPPHVLSAMQNCRLGPAGNVTDRRGYTQYISALGGAPTLTAVGQQRFSAASSATWCIAGTAFYEDVSGTWTARTSTMTITAADDNVWVTANAAGTLVGTNGVTGDDMIKWTAAGGNIAALDVDSRFTTAQVFEYWDGRLWAGNVSTGVDRIYRSALTDIETWSATDFHTVDEDITAVRGMRSALTVHTENTITLLFPTTQALAPYQQEQRASAGAVSPRACVVTPLGQMVYVGRHGIYQWASTPVPQEEGNIPDRISRALDGDRFWDNVNTARLDYSHAVVDPVQGFVFIWLPYGAGQTTNNYTLIWDYVRQRWIGPDIAGARNCSAFFDSKPHAGGYSDGLVYVHEDGTNDDGTAIDSWYETAAPPLVDYGTVVRWLYARHLYTPAGNYNVSVEATADAKDADTESVSVGDDNAAIGSFIIGVSSIGDTATQRAVETDLSGYSASIMLKVRNANLDERFNLRQHLCFGRVLRRQRKEKAGIE